MYLLINVLITWFSDLKYIIIYVTCSSCANMRGRSCPQLPNWWISILFSDCVLRYLHTIHYPGLMLEFGQLKHLWCMQFEGKHQYFKRLSHNTINFKNLCYTLSKRHQCWELTSLDTLHQRSYTEGERQVPFRSLPFDIQEGIALRS